MASLVLGISGVVLCLIGVLAPFALIFGLIAAHQIKRAPAVWSGLGMARAGWILGVVGIVLSVGFWWLAAADGAFDETGPTAIDELGVGDCVDVDDDSEQVLAVPVVRCDGPHNAEVISVGTLEALGLTDGDDDESIESELRRHCAGDVFRRYVGVAHESSVLELYYLYNRQRLWFDGPGESAGATFACIAHDGQALTESVQGSAR